MKKGFTLLEILASIGIISILVVIGVPAFQMIRNNVSLKNYSKEIASVLKISQNDAITAQGGTTHGVYFEQNKYYVCKDDCSSTPDPHLFNLNNGIEIISGVDEAIVFDRLSGELILSEDDKSNGITEKIIQIGFPGGQQKIIQINSNGRISIL
ncbi:MAG: prepilin-type N-terminal cleavage/methylation domain-containing protein [bacterium]|nr:prepilin-type N-terminal cleavage/methylation domain-containing protein [bacterium]